ncbi:hypothetical protein IFM89_034511 [Coptis chinensis]|uniref:RNase H type-1 domain-containing protein n=1 Tax=Coptis chinensis TaxID=261450 RepID=A0A835HTY0_9MAGN|nr:hypothetical protein IFM89_034511 [Coptis chinensis]
MHFEDLECNVAFCKQYICLHVNIAAHLSRGYMRDSYPDKVLLSKWGVWRKLGRAPRISQCKWLAPHPPVLKINVDGSSFGNLGHAGWGAAYRDALVVCLQYEDWYQN